MDKIFYLIQVNNVEELSEVVFNKKLSSDSFKGYASCLSCAEEKYLVEWIEYYKLLGFDSILFGDNNNPGNNSHYDILKKYIDEGFVIYHDLRGDNNYQQQKFYQ